MKNTLYTIAIIMALAAAAAAQQLPATSYQNVTWTPDGKGLIVLDDRIHRAVRVDVANPAHRTPVAEPA